MSTTSAPGSRPRPTRRQHRPYRGRVFRLVEAQHRISTNRLVADAAEQALLEQLVEAVKPTLPPAARGLHYLLATPFRYGHSRATRFRRAGERLGIFYCAEACATAVAETAYWRLLFFARAPGTKLPVAASEHSAFSVRLDVGRALDLTAPPLARGRRFWTDPDDYSACQAFAAEARAIGTQGLRYASVRDPAGGANFALFDPAGFEESPPRIEQTWHLRFEGAGAAARLVAFAAFPSTAVQEFSFGQFGLSPP